MPSTCDYPPQLLAPMHPSNAPCHAITVSLFPPAVQTVLFISPNHSLLPALQLRPEAMLVVLVVTRNRRSDPRIHLLLQRRQRLRPTRGVRDRTLRLSASGLGDAFDEHWAGHVSLVSQHHDVFSEPSLTGKRLLHIHLFPRARLHKHTAVLPRPLHARLRAHLPPVLQVAFVPCDDLHRGDPPAIHPLLRLDVDQLREVLQRVQRRERGDVVDEQEGVRAL